MWIKLTRDVVQINDAPMLLAGAEFGTVEGADTGAHIGDKPGFLTIQTSDGELVVFSPEFELVYPLRLFADG